MSDESPLGRQTGYPDRYAPELLHAIPRADSRDAIGVGDALPFYGVDIWNAWELTWLGQNGQPRVAAAELRVPADSPRIVESKSLKLYLNSFSMSRYDAPGNVARAIRKDLKRSTGAAVDVHLYSAPPADGIAALPGATIDTLDVDCSAYEVDATLLSSNPNENAAETLCSDVLRSLCPVTGQPDTGSVMIDYTGPRIDRAGLLRYIVSYRQHGDFHEACVERIFVDVQARCRPERLAVYARYQRRGGIDINPFRSSSDVRPDNLRLWRQ